MKKLSLIIVSCLLNLLSFGQELLTPEQAVAIAIEKNFDIRIARNETEIATINNNKGAAGMLPTIDIRTGDVFNLNNLNQEFTNGTSVVKNWVPINSFNASANLDWTVFDGLRMFATKERLEALQSVSLIQLQQQIQNTIALVLNTYYDVVRQKQQIKALTESAKISQERVLISQKKFEVGYSDKTPLLQAQVDMNSRQATKLEYYMALDNSKATLNQLLGREAETVFEVIDSIPMDMPMELQALKDSLENSYLVQIGLKNIEIARIQRKEINAQRLPSINFSTGYNFTQNNSKAGFQIFNRSYGPTVGLSAVIPIYQGGVVKKQLEASAVNIASQQIALQQLKSDLNNRIVNAFRSYQNAIDVLKIKEENVSIARENVSVTLERFRSNQATSLEIREAQGMYEEAMYAVILARYNAKLAETELKRINNELVK